LTTVFLHPLGLDSKCWDLLNLEDCILLDLAGHGSRSHQTTGPRINELSEDVFEQINSLDGSGVFDFVGLSLGAAVAMNFALDHPERVRSMVLACTSAKANTPVMEERAKSVLVLGLAGVVGLTGGFTVLVGGLGVEPTGGFTTGGLGVPPVGVLTTGLPVILS
jgi:pimeloyl-ACP methyl ester carboxylesterase